MQPFYPPPPPPSQQIMKQPEMVDQNSAPYYHQGQNNVQSVQQVTVKTSISDFNSQKYFMPPDAQHFATQNRQVIQEPL